MILKTLLFFSMISEVFLAIHQISWSQVLVDKSSANIKTTLQVSAVEAAITCAKTDDCNLVCAVEEGYGLSQQKVSAEYFERSVGTQYTCWTKMQLLHTPEKLVADGLSYHVQIRSDKMTGGQCVNFCRRIPGYRSAIIRTNQQFNALASKYYISDLCYIGLVRKIKNGEFVEEEYEWHDGTPYELDTPVYSNNNSKYFLLKSNHIDDWDGQANCMCQGNPNYVTW